MMYTNRQFTAMPRSEVAQTLREVGSVVAHAMDFATVAHAGQTRAFLQGDELRKLPYTHHPFRVALRVWTWFGDVVKSSHNT